MRVARVPAGEDPDSLVRNQGAEALRAVIAEARDFFDDALDEELTPGVTPQRRAALARKIAAFVKIISDPALREAVTTRMRARLELTDAAFSALVKEAKLPDPDREEESAAPEVAAEIELPEAARLLCRLAILSPEAREWMRARSEPAATFGPAYALVDRLLSADAPLEEPAGFATFSATLPRAEERALVGLRLGSKPENAPQRAADTWAGLLRQKLSGEIAALQARQRLPGLSVEEVASLHKQILDLQKRLRDL